MKHFFIFLILIAIFPANADWLDKDLTFQVKSEFLNFRLRKKANYIHFTHQKENLGFYSSECTKKYEEALSAIISDQVGLLMGIEIPKNSIPAGLFILNNRETPFYSNPKIQPGLARVGSRMLPVIKEATRSCQ